MKKETLIIFFYVLYFGWLFTVTYLTPNALWISYFVLAVVFFYFVFLREKGDVIVFLIAFLLALAFRALTLSLTSFSFDLNLIISTPFWLPTAWGITAVALRKFYLILTK